MRRAIVVGCSKYRDPLISDLQFAHLDARHFAGILTRYCGFDSEDVVIFSDDEPTEQPTRDNVMDALTDLLEAEIESFVFFFSGHGFKSASDNSNYLATPRTRWTSPESNSIRLAELVGLVQKFEGSGARILFLDACRSVLRGKGFDDARHQIDLSDPDVRGSRAANLITYASCGPGEVAYEDESVEGGIFTQALLRGLSSDGRCTTVRELDDFLRRETPRISQEMGRPRQTPQTSVDDLRALDVVLVSDVVRDAWRDQQPVGTELRVGAAQPLPRRSDRANPLVAIDFGTSYSAAAVSVDGEVTLVQCPDGHALLPSAVAFLPSGGYVVGQEALDARARSDIQVVANVKRLLGLGQGVEVNGRVLSAELIASLVIRSLRQNLEEALGTAVTECMVAYPADFGIARCAALLKAFDLAGLNVVRMIGEPNVASLLVLEQRPDWEGRCLVVDLGGGTFDVAVVNCGDGVIEVESVAGSNHLGGSDYDAAVAAELRRNIGETFPELKLDPILESRLSQEAERAKRALSSQEVAEVRLEAEVDGNLCELRYEVTRDIFRTLTHALDGEVSRVASAAIEDSWESGSDISVLVLTGQGTRIFTVAEALGRVVDVGDTIDRYQENAVVLGLAKCAQVLTGERRDMLLLDLSHRGIGIRCRLLHTGSVGNGLFGPAEIYRAAMTSEYERTVTVNLVDRLTTIPTKRTEQIEFVAETSEAPDVITLTVVERSRTSGAEEEIIGRVAFPTMGASSLSLELTIQIDANGAMVLSVNDWRRRRVMLLQLNQPYRRQRAYTERDQLNLILDGYTLYPLQLISSTAAVPKPESLESFDVERWTQRVRAEVVEYSRWARDGQSAKRQIAVSDGWLASVLLRQGQPQLAEDLLWPALTELASQGVWRDLGKSLRALAALIDQTGRMDDRRAGAFLSGLEMATLSTSAAELGAAIPLIELVLTTFQRAAPERLTSALQKLLSEVRERQDTGPTVK